MSSVTSDETLSLVSMLENAVTNPSSSSSSGSGPGHKRPRLKRPAALNSSKNFPGELSEKRAKIQFGLASNKGSTTFIFPKPEANIPGGIKSKLPPPAIPAIARFSPANTVKMMSSSTSSSTSTANNRNSIHGRKTISIREQQQKQIGRAHEVINRLKAEQKNKGLSSSQEPQRSRPSTTNSFNLKKS
uniref:Uncharacterized protein n=1 Tax=Panagrolaimus davidi TaxID=227884 RepID=A0A914QV04_9BILA